ncbi:MAG: hypothetical protein ACI856_001189 [Kiritimatiellia bacterium]|jgi:hypothetical protein
MKKVLKIAAVGSVPKAATLRGFNVKISNHLQKIPKDTKAQALLPVEPTGLHRG